MTKINVKYRDWIFEVDRELTIKTYEKIYESGADGCFCSDCKNYITYRDKIFPDEIISLFTDLGIDYHKEVEIASFEEVKNGLHHINGWFHFKGKILSGKDCKVQLANSGFTLDLTKITDNFQIGFTEANDLTFFDEKTGLVQVEFITYIPWVIDKELEL